MPIKPTILIYKGDLKLKKIIVLLFSLSIAACSSSDSGSSTPQTASIVGAWSFIYPSVQCTETYVFNANDTFSATSLDEVFGGTYAFTAQANSSNRYPFSFTVTSDNQQFDCEGDNANDVGLVVDIFADFPSATVMNWYLQSSGGTPVVTLNKQ